LAHFDSAASLKNTPNSPLWLDRALTAKRATAVHANR
jgi:hypothetical protein